MDKLKRTIGKKLNIKAFAKINLFLDLNFKKADGYHDISSVMQTINLYDDVNLKIIERNIEIVCDNKDIPVDHRNTCYRAANYIFEKYNINLGIKIEIVKRIPSEAGLGGGSSDSAAVIKGLNELLNLNMTISDMIEIGKKVGADVPFCLVGGTCLCEGIGEKVTEVRPFVWDNIVLIKPDFSISTPKLYSKCTPDDYKLNDLQGFLKLIKSEEYCSLVERLSNTLETVAIREYPQIDIIKNDLIDFGCINAIMTGSGSVVVGFIKKGDKEKVMNKICEKYSKVYFTSTLNFDENKFFR